MIVLSEIMLKRFKYGLFECDINSEYLDQLEYKNNSRQSYDSFDNFKEKVVEIIPITQINHQIREIGTPIFKDGENAEGLFLTAKERVMNILSGFENGVKIKPIILYRGNNVDENINIFKLYDGCHRLYCSIIYGYKYIPAIIYRKVDLYPD